MPRIDQYAQTYGAAIRADFQFGHWWGHAIMLDLRTGYGFTHLGDLVVGAPTLGLGLAFRMDEP